MCYWRFPRTLRNIWHISCQNWEIHHPGCQVSSSGFNQPFLLKQFLVFISIPTLNAPLLMGNHPPCTMLKLIPWIGHLCAGSHTILLWLFHCNWDRPLVVETCSDLSVLFIFLNTKQAVWNLKSVTQNRKTFRIFGASVLFFITAINCLSEEFVNPKFCLKLK